MSPEKYVEFNRALMTSNTRLQNEIELQVAVESLGLKWNDVKTKSESMDVQLTLKKIRDIAQGFEVTGTPAFIVDGEILRGAPRNEGMVLGLFKK
jgi:protein-disulfide isomerase